MLEEARRRLRGRTASLDTYIDDWSKQIAERVKRYEATMSRSAVESEGIPLTRHREIKKDYNKDHGTLTTVLSSDGK